MFRAEGLLNVTSCYTFLKSNIKINDLITHALKNKQSFVAICDVNNLYALSEFYQLALKNCLRPIIGSKVLIKFDEKVFCKFSLFCKNENGYQNLCKILKVTNETNKNWISFNDFHNLQDNLNIVIDSKDSLLTKYIESGKIVLAKKFFRYLKKHFNNLFLGVSDNSTAELFPDEKVIAFNQISALKKTDYQVLNYLNAINDDIHEQEKKFLVFPKDFQNFLVDNNHFHFSQVIVESTKMFCENINLILPRKELQLKYFSGVESSDFAVKCHRELVKKLSISPTENYLKRLDYEIEIITSRQLENYFLIVADYVSFARKNGILVGPGRGSAPGSLVSFALGITAVDPIKENLLFERFLNPQRKSFPDIDIDVQDDLRHKLIEYLVEKYGPERVAYIITFQTIQIKNAIRDVGRVQQISQIEISEINKLLKNFTNNFEYFERSSSELRAYYWKYPLLFKIAYSIIGLPRQVGLHAAGIVLSNKPLCEIVPVQESTQNGIFATQVSMNYLTHWGLLKMDILGLKNLTIIRDICLTANLKLDGLFSGINFSDEKTLDLLSNANTTGIFQLESPGMRRTLRTVGVSKFNDVVASLALFRPGPQKFIVNYAARKRGREKIDYIDESLKKVLTPTFGIIIYQEQVIQLVQIFAGYNASEADLFRRVISKKNSDLMREQATKFVNSAVKLGHSVELSRKVFIIINRFANYGFNLSHAYSYAVISYLMAYLKVHQSKYFFQALLNNFLGDNTKTEQYYLEAKTFGVNFSFASPDLLSSDYQIKKSSIIVPITIIKGIGINLVNNLFNSFNAVKPENIYEAIAVCIFAKLPIKFLEALVWLGFFDKFSLTRSSIFNALIDIVEYAKLCSTKNSKTQTIFIKETLLMPPKILNIPENNAEIIRFQQKFLGFILDIKH